MNCSLKQLEVFVIVAQEKSFSRTGERVDLSQSTMSHSVRELKNHISVRLLDRTTRKMVLTDAGQQLTLCLERLLGELSSTLRDIGRMGQQLGGKVWVVTNQTIPAHLIPQCTAESHRCYPDVQFVLHGHPRQWVMESIRQRDVDFGIVIDLGPVGDLQCEAILPEPFFLLCYRDSALTVKDYVPWQALQGVKSVLQDYALGSRPLIDAAPARNGIQANIVQEIGRPVTLLPMITAGISISILPAPALPLSEGSPLAVKRIMPAIERQLMLVCRKNCSLSTATEALWGVVRDQGNALMAGREGDLLYRM